MLAAVILSLVSSATPSVQLNWLNGGIADIGQDIACLSNPPITETRVQAYSGYTYWPPPAQSPQISQTPALNEVFYAHVVISHPGNPCSGSALGIGIIPASGTALAISAVNPVICLARLRNGTVIDLGNDVDYGCPQTLGYDGFSQSYRLYPPNGGARNSSNQPTYAWGMAQGTWLEFFVPLAGSAAQYGSNNLYFWVNPDIGVYGYPGIPQYVNDDVIFRNTVEDYALTADIAF